MTTALRRELSVRQIEFIVIGGAIGAGMFIGSSQALSMAGTALLPAYAVCGLVVYMIARCLGELSLADPNQGTFFNHIRNQLGRQAGFVSGWSYWLTTILAAMAEMTAVGLLLHAWFPNVPQWLPPFLVLLLLFSVNRARVEIYGEAEFWLALLKIITMVGFLLLGLAAVLVPARLGLHGADISNLWHLGGVFPTGWRGFLAVLPIALFSFGGFELVSLAAAEAADPLRALPRAINGLMIRLVVFYIGTTAALLVLLPWTEEVPGTSPFVVVLSRLGIPFAASLLNAIVITAVTSSCNSLLFGSSRTLRSLALDGNAPASWATSSQRGVPARATAISTAAVSFAIVLNYLLPHGIFVLLLEMLALITAVNWILIMLAHLQYRRRIGPRQPSRFPAPWSPWSNYVVIVFALVILALLASSTATRLPIMLGSLGFAILACGAWLHGRRVG